MSKRIKLDFKNVTPGLKSFSDFLAGHELIKHGPSQAVVPKTISFVRPGVNYFKQDYFYRNTLDLTKIPILAQPAEGPACKDISTKIASLTIKWPETVNFGSICTPDGLPRRSPYYCYYDVPQPQCPPPEPKPCDGGTKSPLSAPPRGPCPPPTIVKKSHICFPPKAKPFPAPCGTSKEKPRSPCGRNMFVSDICIYASKSRPCPPKGGGSGSKGSTKGPICPPSKGVKDCPPKGGGGKRKGGNICPPQKQVKDCPPKGKSRKGGGGICPPQPKIKDCPPKGKGRSGGKSSICPPPKKSAACQPAGKGPPPGPKKCPPRSSSSGGGDSGKPVLIRRLPSCPPKQK